MLERGVEWSNGASRDTCANVFLFCVPLCSGGILGMGALVKLFPYSVPEWLPPVMVRLADHAGDPEPLGKTVRAIMQVRERE